jgi:hypothetical protein
MKKKIVFLVLGLISLSLLSACPHRPRHGHIPKPRPHIPKPRLPHLMNEAPVQIEALKKVAMQRNEYY